jgi:hypothetical protein
MKEILTILLVLVMGAMAIITYELSYNKNIFIQKIMMYNDHISKYNNYYFPQAIIGLSYSIKHYAINETDLIDNAVLNDKYLGLVDNYISTKKKYNKRLLLLFFIFLVLAAIKIYN